MRRHKLMKTTWWMREFRNLPLFGILALPNKEVQSDTCIVNPNNDVSDSGEQTNDSEKARDEY
jgi:hypothetical protein